MNNNFSTRVYNPNLETPNMSRDTGVLGPGNPQYQNYNNGNMLNPQFNPMVPQQTDQTIRGYSNIPLQYNQNDINTAMPFPDFDPSIRATHPSEKITTVEHTVVIDSRQRDFKRYPNPSRYKIELGRIYKNVTSIELKGSIIPKSCYNVHNTNSYIDFSIGSSVTSIRIKNPGYGYVNPIAIISSPQNGTQATATVFVNSSGNITNISVNIVGSGYRQGVPPEVLIYGQNGTGSGAVVEAVIGTHYTASLRQGQYTIGGNPTSSSSLPTGLLLEVQNAMNHAVNGGAYDPESTGPFEVRLVSQYPELGAIPGTPEASNTNATRFNRIQITNVEMDDWELLWIYGKHNRVNACNLLGFNNINYSNTYITVPVQDIMTGGKTIRADYDYDLLDDPKYVLLSFWTNDNSFNRLESADSSIDRRFGTMIFDANNANVLTDTSGTIVVDPITGAEHLQGPLTKGAFWGAPGILKPIRGFDFDQKKLEFTPPIGKINSLDIEFTQYNTDSSLDQKLYDFGNKNHTLIFSIRMGDPLSGKKS